MIYIDIETQSDFDLSYGVHRYVAHPSTRILTLAWLDDEPHVWFPTLLIPPQIDGVVTHVGPEPPVPTDRSWVGHNVESFDRLLWEAHYPEHKPIKWVDTYPLALSAGLPGGLDRLARLLGYGKKDESGRKVLLKWCKSRKDPPLPVLLAIAKYNVQDVLLTRRVYEYLQSVTTPTPIESRVYAAHLSINRRGVKVDRRLVKSLIDLSHKTREDAFQQIYALTGLTQADVQSRAKMMKWLESKTVRLPNLRRECVARFIDDSETDTFDDGVDDAVVKQVVQVLTLRMQALRITGAKLDAALTAMDDADDRIRYWAVYWGAHTGRWAARLIQPHNFPRPKVDPWPLIQQFESDGLDYDRIKAEYGSVDDVTSSLLRCIFIPENGSLLAADLSNIEARVLAWCAGENRLLQTYWDNADPYVDMAERIYGPKENWPGGFTKKHPYRQVGKTIVLGCGYQLGVTKFAAYAAGAGIDLTGTTAAECVASYRAAYPRIVALWYDLSRTVVTAVREGVRLRCGRCQWYVTGGALHCVLPSGRVLRYHDVMLEDIRDRVPWDADGPVWAVSYESPRYGRRLLYGGMLAENIVQAISRDVLAEAIVRLEDAGLPVVLHVHDEVVCDGGDVDTFLRCITTTPDWLVGFPLDAEGGPLPRYAKSPPKGVIESVYRNGGPLNV